MRFVFQNAMSLVRLLLGFVRTFPLYPQAKFPQRRVNQISNIRVDKPRKAHFHLSPYG
jgi:hypothetical protein